MGQFTPPKIGQLPQGKHNLITDVIGVSVGNVTLSQDAIQTGVTVIRPHQEDIFKQKVPAAVSVLNGFGKSIGLVQVEELGVIETPIALTNTFSVAAVAEGQIRQAIKDNPEIGRTLSTVNPLVFECNDGYLNDIQKMKVSPDNYHQAYQQANIQFAQGSVGAGRGMSCFELKGGIGSSSRVAGLKNGKKFTVGSLVLANFGLLDCLILASHPLGKKLSAMLTSQVAKPCFENEKGSIIMIIATDAPVSARQLKRISLRAGAGLARTGSFMGNGSGDIALAFSTAYTIPHDIHEPMPDVPLLNDGLLDPLFQATVDTIEQSIVNALFYAKSVTGRDDHHRMGLMELVPEITSFLS